MHCYSFMLQFNENGIYVPGADLYIDPWRPVKRALITHAHSDHARPGMQQYLCTPETATILQQRLGIKGAMTIAYGQKFYVNGYTFSLHPAGHVLGSAQIRIEYKGRIIVVTGDYKLEDDLFCKPFESIPCHEMVSESTFGLPVFHWKPQQEIIGEIADWWQFNADNNISSVLLVYALGKAQRILSQLQGQLPGNLIGHGAIVQLNEHLRNHGYKLPLVSPLEEVNKSEWNKALILAPGSVLGSKWLQRFQNYKTGYVSGWMALRGNKRRLSVDRGFVLSDHADWNGLNEAISSAKPEKVYVTHGFSSTFSTWLKDKGYDAQPVATGFEGEKAERTHQTETNTNEAQ